MALGFLVDDIPMCCECALWYARESGYPHLFFALNRTIEMDDNKICCCGKYPNRQECLDAADKITELIS